MIKDVRPTTGRVLLALFSILGEIEGKSFLDLFAGTGSVGIEALKRGAGSCVFVENLKSRADSIREKTNASSIVLSLDIRRAISWLVKREITFDFIFADPPYNSGWCEEFLRLPNLDRLFNSEGLLVFEHSVREKMILPPENFEIISEREYGETCLTFVKNLKGQNKLELHT